MKHHVISLTYNELFKSNLDKVKDFFGAIDEAETLAMCLSLALHVMETVNTDKSRTIKIGNDISGAVKNIKISNE